MRTEQEMLHLIITTANEDARIRAVYMNGSRVNTNAPKDIFQDYDIVYVVTETLSFRKDRHWIDRFGERLYMQYPEDNSVYENDVVNCYGWLIQLCDGNRLDLHVQTIPYSQTAITKDTLCRILLDKDHCLPAIPAASDKTYWVQKPSQEDFHFVCNEFWWCLNNVAKGLWRGEIPYVQDTLNLYLRPQLLTLLSWKAGYLTNFTCSIGKSGKYLYRFLSEDEWNAYLQTYAGGQLDEIWDKTLLMCRHFHQSAQELSGILEFEYDRKEADASMNFLKHVKNLPRDAGAIFE